MSGDPSEFVVGWGTLSLINAGLAQGKGRSGGAWWLISLLLGPIATMLIVLLGPVYVDESRDEKTHRPAAPAATGPALAANAAPAAR